MRALVLVALIACATLAAAAEVETQSAVALQRVTLLQELQLQLNDASPSVSSSGTLRGVPHVSSAVSGSSSGSKKPTLSVPSFPSLSKSVSKSMSKVFSRSSASKSKIGSKKSSSKSGSRKNKHKSEASARSSKRKLIEERILICRSGKHGALKCPYPTGTCCSDGASCCPPKFVCDGKGGCILHATESAAEQASEQAEEATAPLQRMSKRRRNNRRRRVMSASRTSSLRGVPGFDSDASFSGSVSGSNLARPIIIHNTPQNRPRPSATKDNQNKVTIISNDNTLVTGADKNTQA